MCAAVTPDPTQEREEQFHYVKCITGSVQLVENTSDGAGQGAQEKKKTNQNLSVAASSCSGLGLTLNYILRVKNGSCVHLHEMQVIAKSLLQAWQTFLSIRQYI